MRAQKVPIGPKGEATNQVIFLTPNHKGQGVAGGAESRSRCLSGAPSWNVGHESNLSGSKMDENSLLRAQKVPIGPKGEATNQVFFS